MYVTNVTNMTQVSKLNSWAKKSLSSSSSINAAVVVTAAFATAATLVGAVFFYHRRLDHSRPLIEMTGSVRAANKSDGALNSECEGSSQYPESLPVEESLHGGFELDLFEASSR